MPTRLLVLALLATSGLAAQAQQTIRPGEGVQGALSPGDAVLVEDGSFYDLYVVRAAPGEELEITMRSTAFDTYLIGGETEGDALAGTDFDDDGAGGTDSQLIVFAGAGGTYWFLANSLEPGDTGSYSISVRSLGGGTPASGPGTIRSGETLSGSLGPGDDILPDESFVDVYTYEGAPGDVLTVTLSSQDFDAYLSGGRTENGQFVFEVSDDDSGGGTDAQFTVEVGYSGTYTIRANSLRAGEVGAYTLTAEAEGGGLAQADVLRPGETAGGSLGASSPTLGDGSWYHLYEIQAEPFEALEIALTSGDFDAYLVGGTTPDGALGVEVSDDDGGGGTDALLRVEAGPDGRFYAIANTYSAGQSGRYEIAVASLGGGTPMDDGIVTLQLGDSVAGELTADDPTMDDGSHFDIYVYEGAPGEEVEITLSSPDFDTYLLLRRAFGDGLENIAEDDDGGDGTNSRLLVTLDRSGTYVIGANTYAAAATGRYTLSIARPDGSAPDASSGLSALRTGQPVSGSLDAGDATLPDDSYVDRYVYRGTPGERVTVTMRSAAFNAYLLVAAVSGDNLETVGRDDDSAGGTDARLTFTVEGNGVYAIQANSLSAGETGAYSLVVERAGAAPSTGPVANARFAGKWAPATYEPSSSYQAIRERVQSARRLETTIASLNEEYPLPRNVPVSFEECGIINAQYLYNETFGRVRFCYELMDYLSDVLEPQVGTERLAEAVNGAYEFIMLHEAGHALRHQLDLPITGREEDVADQFAALVLIRQGSKGARAAIDGVLALQSGGTFTDSDYAGEHSLGPQRLYNVVCLVYGSDPAKYASLVGPDGLPEERAVRCESEFAQVEKSFDRLLGLVYGEE